MTVRHVFVLMLENRSFDHIFGRAGLLEPDTLASVGVGDAAGESAAPFAMEFDPGHEFEDVVVQLGGPGTVFRRGEPYPACINTGFEDDARLKLAGIGSAIDPRIVMAGFTPSQLPVLHALADEFAVCDRWFSSMPGPTWPNRLFVHAATSGGLDSSPTAAQSLSVMFKGYAFAGGTIFDRLEASGMPWLIVEGDALPQSLSLGGMVGHVLAGHFVDLDEFDRRVSDPAFEAAYTFIEPHYGHVLADGRNFKCGNSMHPLDDVTRGEALVKRVYEAVRASPHWDESLLVVTYDEHGGFYDHVPPPKGVPPGDPNLPGLNRHGFTFDQLGVRVPAIVISPLIERGTVDHTTFDHSSIPATIEHLFGLQPMTARDAAASTLEHLLTRPAPRDDCPLHLPEPAISGIPDCEDGPTSGLAADLETLPEHLAGDFEPALAGFLQIAVAREIQMAAAVDGDVDRAVASERVRLEAAFSAIQTKFDAVRLLRSVEERYQRWRSQL